MSLSRSDLLGSWQLVSFEVRDADGGLRHPFGDRPRGLILYTGDGAMSAHLAPTPGIEPDEHIAYCGGFDLDETTGVVHHRVTLSTRPELLTTPQLRTATVAGDLLTLSTDEATLTWRRTR